MNIRDKQFSALFTPILLSFYSVLFNNQNNYATVKFIDPDFTGESTGSIQFPLKNLNQVDRTVGDIAYLIKAGTTHSIGANIEFISNASNIMIGSYGLGDRPIITGGRLIFKKSNITLRDIVARSFNFGTTGENGTGFYVFNCKFDCKGDNNVIFGVNTKIIGVEIDESTQDNLFVQQVNLNVEQNFEIGYSKLTRANQRWLPAGELESIAGGDGIQFNPFKGTYRIHNCIIDRSDTGNKFCIICNIGKTGSTEVYPSLGIIENNFLYGPKNFPSGSNLLYFGNVPNPTPTMTHKIVIRNNFMVGTWASEVSKYTGTGIYCNNSPMEIYGNLFLDLETGAKVGSSRSLGDVNIYNNTFYNIIVRSITDGATNIYNNILPNRTYTTPTNQGNNLFLSEAGAANVFVDHLNEDYRLKIDSLAMNIGSWQPFMQPSYVLDILGSGVRHDNTIDVGAAQYYDITDDPTPGDPEQPIDEFTLDITVVGTGTVTKTPNKALYYFGEEVLITAIPDTENQTIQWEGDATGTGLQKTVYTNESKQVTVTFSNLVALPVAPELPTIPANSIDYFNTVNNAAAQLKTNIEHLKVLYEANISNVDFVNITNTDTGATLRFKLNQFGDIINDVNTLIIELNLTTDELSDVIFGSGITEDVFMQKITDAIHLTYLKLQEMVALLNIDNP